MRIFDSIRSVLYIFIFLLIVEPSQALDLKNKPVDVLIVGAGLAGLSTAYYLKKAGVSYQILELSPHIGGRIRTASYSNGTSGEVGLEEFWGNNPALDIARELKLPAENTITTFSSYIFEGKLIPFLNNTNEEFIAAQFSPEELSAYRKWDQKAIDLEKQIHTEKLSPELLVLKDLSFADWVKKEPDLTPKIQNFIRIMSEPEYATSWQNISALDGIAEWHIFAGKGIPAFHIVGGNQKLAEAIAKSIGINRITLNTRVSRIQSLKDSVIVTGSNLGTFQETKFPAKYVVSTVPLYRLGEIQFDPPINPERKKAIQTQSWGSYFTAHVILDAKAKQFWTIKGESCLPILSDGPLGVIYGESTQSKSPSVTLLNLLITGTNAERLNFRAVAMDDIRAELLQALEKQWPGIQKFIQSFEFYPYHPRAIASWPVGRSRFDSLSQLMRQPEGRVYFAGDFTEGTHSNGAAESALRVKSQILKALGTSKAKK